MTYVNKIYGDRLPAGSVGPRKVAANPTSKAASPPIPLGRFFRNGLHPDAHAANAMAEAANQAALYRSKQLFVGASRMDMFGRVSSYGAGDRARWRFAFRTGPYTHAIYVRALLGAPTSGFSYGTKAKLEIFSDTQEASLVGSAEMVWGASDSSTPTDGWNRLRESSATIDLSPDTDYYARFSDVDYGRIFSACVFDLPSLTENNSGYLAINNTAMTPIVDSTRENQAAILRNVWKKAGSTVFTWSVNDGTAPVTRTASTTHVNVFDTSVTAISASSPGYTLDMTNKDRLSQTSGVPCVMKAFGKMSTGTNGSIYLKDSGGSVVASIVSAWGTTANWQSVSFNLPATAAKYDLHVAGPAANTFSLYAISVYEYET